MDFAAGALSGGHIQEDGLPHFGNMTGTARNRERPMSWVYLILAGLRVGDASQHVQLSHPNDIAR